MILLETRAQLGSSEGHMCAGTHSGSTESNTARASAAAIVVRPGGSNSGPTVPNGP